MHQAGPCDWFHPDWQGGVLQNSHTTPVSCKQDGVSASKCRSLPGMTKGTRTGGRGFDPTRGHNSSDPARCTTITLVNGRAEEDARAQPDWGKSERANATRIPLERGGAATIPSVGHAIESVFHKLVFVH